MRKKYIFIISIGIAAIIISMAFIYKKFNKTKVGTFSINDYKEYIEEFPSDKQTLPIDDAKVALMEAERIWLDIYGKEVKDKKPYKVFWDKDSDTWLIRGSLPKNMDGGVPYILIRKSDGKVLAVWHDK